MTMMINWMMEENSSAIITDTMTEGHSTTTIKNSTTCSLVVDYKDDEEDMMNRKVSPKQQQQQQQQPLPKAAKTEEKKPSCVTTTAATTTTTARQQSQRSQQQQRKVIFELQKTILYEIPKLDDIPLDEINATWYNKLEYQEIRNSNKVTVKLLLNSGSPIITDSERYGHCYRGLEYRIPKENKHRNTFIQNGINVVLQTQKFLKLNNNNNNNENMAKQISMFYSLETWKAQHEAHMRGVTDAQVVESIWIVKRTIDQPPTIPRRTWARAG